MTKSDFLFYQIRIQENLTVAMDALKSKPNSIYWQQSVARKLEALATLQKRYKESKI
jgi:hypothetical protein